MPAHSSLTLPAGLDIHEIFGQCALQTFDQVARSFNLARINVNEPNDPEANYLKIPLVPSFDNETNFPDLQDAAKVMLVGVIQGLKRDVHPARRVYDDVLKILMQSPLLCLVEGKIEHNSKITMLGGKELVAGTPLALADEGLDEVQRWYFSLLRELDVKRGARIDHGFWDRISTRPMTLEGLGKNLFGKEHGIKQLVDLGVLRFPSREQQFFKLYSITVEAWTQSKRAAIVLTDEQWGITFELKSHIFAPNLPVIDRLSNETKEKACRTADGMFVRNT